MAIDSGGYTSWVTSAGATSGPIQLGISAPYGPANLPQAVTPVLHWVEATLGPAGLAAVTGLVMVIEGVTADTGILIGGSGGSNAQAAAYFNWWFEPVTTAAQPCKLRKEFTGGMKLAKNSTGVWYLTAMAPTAAMTYAQLLTGVQNAAAPTNTVAPSTVANINIACGYHLERN